jgi:tetratricopeptide (TPR) repeat protein
MKIILSALTLFGWLVLSSYAENKNAQELFEQANLALSNQQWEQAENLYQEIISTSGVSVPLYYNLAQAQWNNQHRGQAVASLWKATILDPFHPSTADLLQVYTQELGVNNALTTPKRWLIAWSYYGSFYALTLGLIGLIVCWLVKKFNTSLKQAIQTTSSLLTLLGCLGLCTYFIQPEVAIVTQSQATHVSPFETSPQSFFVREGEAISIIERHQNFYLLKNQSGQSGWIQAESVEPVVKN